MPVVQRITGMSCIARGNEQKLRQAAGGSGRRQAGGGQAAGGSGRQATGGAAGGRGRAQSFEMCHPRIHSFTAS